MMIGTSTRFDSIMLYLERAQNRMARLEAQISTGKVAQSFAEQPQAIQLISLKSTTAAREQYLSNIDTAQIRLDVTGKALDSLSDIAVEMQRLLVPNTTETPQSRKQVAQGYLQQVISLLNTQSGDAYAFGGLDTDSPPVRFDDDPLDDDIWGLGLPTGYFNVPPFTAAASGKFGSSAPYDAVADGYRALYYRGGPGVADDGSVAAGLKLRAGRDIEVPVGFSAAEPAFEKLLRGIHIVASLPAEIPVANPPHGDFTEVDYANAMTSARQIIEQAKGDLKDVQIRTSSAQVMLNNAAETHRNMLKVEQPLIAKLEEADPAQAIVSYQKFQIQIQAMYELSVKIKDLSLVNFLR